MSYKWFFLSIALLCFCTGYSQQDANHKTDSLQKVLATSGLSSADRFSALIELCKVYSSTDLYKAIEYGNQALKLSKVMGEDSSISKAYRTLGLCYYYATNYDKAMEYYRKALSIAQERNDKDGAAAALNNLAAIYSDINELDKSLLYFEQAVELFKQLNDTNRLVACYLNLGSLYEKMKNDSVSIIYLNKAIEKCSNNPDFIPIIIKSKSTLGIIYARKQNYNKAIAYCDDALKTAESAGDFILMGEVHLAFNEIYLMTNKAALVLPHAALAIDYGKRASAKSLIMFGYKNQSEAYALLGQYEQAYKSYQYYTQYNDSVLNEAKLKNIQEIETKYEVEAKQNKITLLSRENELLLKNKIIERQKRYGWIAGSIVMALLGLTFFFNLKSRLAKGKLKQLLADEKLKNSQKELTDFAGLIKRKNDIIQLIKKDVGRLRQCETEAEKRKVQNELFLDLNNYLGTEADAHLFDVRVNELQDDFIRRLEQQFPQLTTQDKQLLMLLKSGLSSKDIAAICKVAPNSVFVHRYRLRKKLNLKTDDSLIAFLNNV